MTYFASNGKEYPFPLVGVFPKPPARQKYAGRTPCGAWWLARPEGRFSAGGIPPIDEHIRLLFQ